MTLKGNISALSTRIGKEIKSVRDEMKWTEIAAVTTTSTVSLPAEFNTVNDLMNASNEFMLVARNGSEYVSSVNPEQAVIAYPATFPVYRYESQVASFTFNSATDTTFNITVTATDQVKMFYR